MSWLITIPIIILVIFGLLVRHVLKEDDDIDYLG